MSLSIANVHLANSGVTVARVVVSNTSSGILSSGAPITLRNQTTEVPVVVEQLADVNVVNEVAGATLVFNATTGEFDVKQLDISEVTGNTTITTVDNGLF